MTTAAVACIGSVRYACAALVWMVKGWASSPPLRTLLLLVRTSTATNAACLARSDLECWRRKAWPLPQTPPLSRRGSGLSRKGRGEAVREPGEARFRPTNHSLIPSLTMSAVPQTGMSRAPCVPCSTSDLDLTTVPPVQAVVEDDYVVRTGPKSSLDGEGPLEFEVISSGNDWLDLSECYLNIKWKIRKHDGSQLKYWNTAREHNPPDMYNQPVNLALHSMFRQVDLTMNERLVYSSGDNYPYRAYVTTLSSYSEKSKKTWLRQLEGWYWDDAAEYEATSNQAHEMKAKDMWNDGGGKSTQLRGRLHLDLVHQGRLIPNNVNVRLILTRSRQEFFMMSWASGQKPFQITIESATLDVRRVKLAPSEQLRLERVLASSSGALYPVTHVVVKNFTLSSGISTAEIDSLFVGQIPNKIFLFMVENEAYSGKYDKNPFNFQHFGLRSCSLSVEGKQLPQNGINVDVDNNEWIEAYYSYVKNCGLYPYDWGNGVTRSQYLGGCFIMAYDLTPDDAGDGVAYLTPRRFGTVRANLRFKTGLSKTVTLLAFATFDNTITIDANRAVTFDYTVWTSCCSVTSWKVWSGLIRSPTDDTWVWCRLINVFLCSLWTVPVSTSSTPDILTVPASIGRVYISTETGAALTGTATAFTRPGGCIPAWLGSIPCYTTACSIRDLSVYCVVYMPCSTRVDEAEVIQLRRICLNTTSRATTVRSALIFACPSAAHYEWWC